MKKAFLYIHGKGGDASEAAHYEALCPGYAVMGMAYASDTPRAAMEEFPRLFDRLCGGYDSVILAANSIGALFSMYALNEKPIQKALFISPIVDMERLMTDMLGWANVTEDDLMTRKRIPTPFGETLFWDDLAYVRAHPLKWRMPTHILYGGRDHLTSYDAMRAFAEQNHASLTVMKEGEHWFHTAEQMAFLDDWVRRTL